MKGQNNYVIINEESGFIEAMSINGFEQKVTPEIMFYYSAYGSTSRIFKVNNSVEEPVAFTDKIQYNVTKYDEVSIEITQTIRFWVIFIIRIYPDTEYIEIEYIIGPTLIG
ncbi:hypothetical protein NQ314_011103 [Rhamnusium bicolor]|uniref:Uncharacterized protein n=1 Tax=Rhamnusium bicolor TaxID=1586634 RepID=A0AAV8XLE1_9CUCU|nr:hypothetical protein NQ314_011103 [Rhamnusium bicolor]